MADKKISALTGASVPLAGTEVLPIVQSGSTVKVAVSDLTAGRAVSTGTLTVVGAINGSNYQTLGTQASSGAGAAITLIPSNSLTNWLVGANYTLPGLFEITPSTAGGGSTFTTPAVTVASTGDVAVKTGNLVIGTSGKGIDFSATPGTGTSELLADYEEGTWTPTLTTTGTNFTLVTLDIARAAYTKIGRVVYVTGTIRSSAAVIGLASGFVVVGGLPFTVDATYDSALTVSYADSWASNTPRTGRFRNSATDFYLINTPTANGDYAINAPASVATGAGSNRVDFSGYFFV